MHRVTVEEIVYLWGKRSPYRAYLPSGLDPLIQGVSDEGVSDDRET
jgi:hypothetical protein